MLFVFYGVISFCIFFRSFIDEDVFVIVMIFDMNVFVFKMFFNSFNCYVSKLLEKVRKWGKICNWCLLWENVWLVLNMGKFVIGI